MKIRSVNLGNKYSRGKCTCSSINYWFWKCQKWLM